MSVMAGGLGAFVKSEEAGLATSGEKAHEAHNRIVELGRLGGMSYLALGEALIGFRASKAYKVLGYETWETYLGEPEVAMSPRTAARMMRIWGVFCRDLGYPSEDLAKIGVAKLDMLCRIVEVALNKAVVEEWMAKALVLSRSDLQDEIDEAMGKTVKERPRSYRVWLGKGADDRPGICFADLKDEDGVLAGRVLDNAVCIGRAQVEVDGLTRVTFVNQEDGEEVEVDAWHLR